MRTIHRYFYSQCLLVLMALGSLFFIPLAAPLVAQDTASCPDFVASALADVGNACAGLAINQACYGNNRVDVTFWGEHDDLDFSAPADRVPLLDLLTIATAPLSIDQSLWGVAMINVQANLDNTLPGQGVMVLLMGDVMLENEVAPEMVAIPVPLVMATVLSGANLRSLPTTSANVVGGAAAGDEVQLIGVDETGDWYELTRDDAGSVWIWGELVEESPGAAELPVTYGTAIEPRYGPMQAFYFSTGVGTAACHEAPDALVIRNPQGEPATLRINDLVVTLSSMAVFSTLEVNGQLAMGIVLLEGRLQTQVNATPVTLIQPKTAYARAFPALVITLNPEGRVDAASRIIPANNTLSGTTVESACENASMLGFDGVMQGKCSRPVLTFNPAVAPTATPTDAPPSAPQPLSRTFDMYINDCTFPGLPASELPIRAGDRVAFNMGTACWPSIAEASAGASRMTFTIDGAPLAAMSGGMPPKEGDDGCIAKLMNTGYWTATAGSHTVTGSTPPEVVGSGQASCTFVVAP